jgi:hypothetical protein
MAAILTNRLLRPRAGFPAAGFLSTPRARRRDPIDLSGRFKRIWSLTCEGLLFFWMLGVVVFSLLVAAGAMGLLG